MNKHWLYLNYVLRHKWYVFWACRRLKVGFWQALTHDWSKFLPSEWVPYANYFYTPYKPQWQDRFNAAWLNHLHRNPHHWQHWVLREDSGIVTALPMPEKYLREMIADWEGAGRAIHGLVEVRAWYEKNHLRQDMHPDTRAAVEKIIKETYR